ncbi:RNB domain-containing ribonuclease [Agrobacterium rubi]|nr:RNB domain-containing ribonuclease [Agrobacterium rubi]NTF24763.1 RNB domain-containing ribonuclease [Agrobacterium rubi]
MAVFPGVTIDAKHSADLDDAIWVEADGTGARVTVSIALVADHVPMGSDLDASAAEIGFTRYNATSAVRTMLDRDLSEQTLSLLPDADRNVMVFDISLDRQLEISSVDIVRGQLLNKGRLSHAEAGDLIESGKGEIGSMMRSAWSLSSALLDKRRRAGAIAYFSAGTGMLTDEEGHLVDLGSSEAVSRAYVVVQEMMILANQAVSMRLASEGVHLLFRNHRGNPVADRAALAVDLELATQGGPFHEAAGKRLEMMIGKATLGSTAQGHFGLNLPVYARLTSPIRRYEDLINQRILLSYIDARPFPYPADELQQIGNRLDALTRDVALERSESFKAMSERNASRLQASGRFSHLDQSDMTAVIKNAVESGIYTSGLEREIDARLANATMTSKDIARLLLAAGDDSRGVRTMVIRHLEESPFAAVSVMNFLHQDGWIGEPRWNDVESGSGYSTTVTASRGGRVFEHSQAAGSKKLSKQRASVGILAEMADMEWSPPSEWSAPISSRSRTDADIDPNAKGTLIALCQSRGLPTPEFEVNAAGAAHDPTFTATAAVRTNGNLMRTAPVTSSSRKMAERLAASAMIDLLADVAAVKRAANPAKGSANAKNALQEKCQKSGWALPTYDFVQSGPSHAPTFTGTAIVNAGGRRVTSAEVSARSRKEAEMLAATDLIERL